MKKLVHNKIILLFFLLVYGIFQAGAKDIYVSVNGSGSQTGNEPSNAVSFSNFINIFEGHRISSGATFNAYFEPGTYTLSKTLTLGSEQGGILFVFDKRSGAVGQVTFVPQYTGSSDAIGIYKTSAVDKGCNITFRNIIFDGFVGDKNETFNVIKVSHNGNVVTLDNVTIQNSDVISGNRDLIYMVTTGGTYHVFVSEINIFNSSIINNSRGTGNICNIKNGNIRIYNSTFSGNTATNVVVTDYVSTNTSALARGYVAFVNNTVYKSGNAQIVNSSASGLFINNIFAGGSIITSGNNIQQYCSSNIIGNGTGSAYSFYANGITGGTPISNFDTDYFNPALTIATGNFEGRAYHQLYQLGSSTTILERGESLDAIGSKIYDTEGFAHLTYDQLGSVRPQKRSIGAIDMNGFKVIDGDVRMYYNNNPRDTVIDLATYVLNYADGLHADNVAFQFVNTSFQPGDMYSISGRNVTITAWDNNYKKERKFEFSVSGTDSHGRVFTETGTVRINLIDLTIGNLSDLPGYIDAGTQCQIDMATVVFNPQYKFITGEYLVKMLYQDQIMIILPSLIRAQP